MSNPNSFELNNISYDVTVVDNVATLDPKLKEFEESLGKCPIVGLDCEWVSQGTAMYQEMKSAASVSNNQGLTILQKNVLECRVALLQLCSVTGSCLLIRLCRFKELPKSLELFLGSTAIVKVGVNIAEDAKRLLNDWNAKVETTLDLRHIVRQSPETMAMLAPVEEGRQASLGLKSLTWVVLQAKLNKDSRIRCGNWCGNFLSSAQMQYAAEDAVASVMVYKRLVHAITGTGFDPTTRQFYFAAEDISEVHYDVPFQQPGKRKRPYGSGTNSTTTGGSNQVTPSPLSSEGRPGVIARIEKNFSKKGPLYDNCILQAPDGECLAMVSYSKVRWYLHKGLAESVEENEEGKVSVVRLKAEPRGRPKGTEMYYTEKKVNQCVVCGHKDVFIRKNVVPHQYRKHFPVEFKDHKAHDVVLLCARCHYRSNDYDLCFQKKLAIRYDAPLNDAKVTRDPLLTKVKGAANALQKSGGKIPDERKLELQGILAGYLGDVDLTPEILQRCCDMEPFATNPDFVSHAERVITGVSNESDGCSALFNFEKEWRKSFIENMKPMFLPVGWSIDHKYERYCDDIVEK